MYRIICRHVDKIPDKMKLHLNCQLTELIKMQSSVKNLKDTYGFRNTLKKKVTEYNRVIGCELDQEKLKEILWTVADFSTKTAATLEKVDLQEYSKLGEFIDKRYRLQYGFLEFGKKNADDMDMSALRAGEAEKEDEGSDKNGDLDAFGKGGKGDSGGGVGGAGGAGKTCYCCNGFGHLSSNCPTAKHSTATHSCFNCQGHSHFGRDCTSA